MSLKKFGKNRPSTVEEVGLLFEAISSDSPRAAVMIAGALLEDTLSGAIKYKLVALTKEEEGLLFEGTGPLATFSSRIRMAYALGVIGKKTRHDLELFKEIRNVFAHSFRNLTFDTEELKQKVQGFHCLKDFEHHQYMLPRDIFNSAVAQLGMFLIKKVGPLPEGARGINLEGNTQLD